MIGRGFASILWGMVADRIGRKPVIIFSIFAVIVLNTLFGLSVKYWMAVTTRFLLGALNGLLAPIKAYSIEVCRAEHQPLGLSIVSTAWGIGLVVGPATGGYLAQPVKQYPHIFHEKSIFGRFPYLLPCLCISLFALLVLLSCIWLPETLHKHKGLEVGVETAEASTTQESAESHQKSLFRNWPLMSSIVTYCVFSLHDTAYSEIFSLWTVSDRKYGGLSFSSKDVGQVLAVAGASLLVYQLFIYGWVDKILGPIHSTRISAALSVPIIAAYPFMTHLSGIRLGVALYSAAMIKSVLAAWKTNTATPRKFHSKDNYNYGHLSSAKQSSATRATGCCKWNSHNSHVLVQGYCSGWGRSYIFLGTKETTCGIFSRSPCCSPLLFSLSSFISSTCVYSWFIVCYCTCS
nr:protein ZINC INDUCED FACILITATOR-LIKE 1 isoform X6 [Oryza sativa Japonica Group]